MFQGQKLFILYRIPLHLTRSSGLQICKLYLYSEEFNRAVTQHNRHIRRFKEMADVWHLALDTFEWWSWATKQFVSLCVCSICMELNVALNSGIDGLPNWSSLASREAFACRPLKRLKPLCPLYHDPIRTSTQLVIQAHSCNILAPTTTWLDSVP